MPAARLFWCLGLTTVLGVVGVIVPAIAYLALGLDALLVLAFLFDLRRARTIVLSAQREWPPLLVQDAEAEVRVTLSLEGSSLEGSSLEGSSLEGSSLEGSSPRDARPVRVRLRETLHPALAPRPLREETEVTSQARSIWTWKTTPPRRGEYIAGPLVARVLGPWGLAWSQRELLPEETRRVYPQVRWEGEVGHLLLLAHRRALGSNPQRLQGIGTELYGLREYVPGDSLGKIHWKATARHGQLVSREETWERGARLLILLDCGRSMSGLDGSRSKLDHALAAALALTRVAASRGDTVTLSAFAEQIERTVRVHGGQRSLQAAYGGLYDLQARLAEPAFDVAAEKAIQLESRRCTTVLFTSVVDLAAAELLRAALLRLERRHRPILINLQDPEIAALAQGAPKHADDAFAKAAAMEILLANQRLGKQLRRSGIRVVNAPANRLALETLQAYLAMFR